MLLGIFQVFCLTPRLEDGQNRAKMGAPLQNANALVSVFYSPHETSTSYYPQRFPKFYIKSMDFNYSQVVEYPDLGNGLAAARDFEEGDAIVRVNEPYLIIVEKKALQEVSCSKIIIVATVNLDQVCSQ